MGSEATYFKKGYDPRRYTQNDGLMDYHNKLNQELRKHSMLAVKVMVDILKDPKANKVLKAKVAQDLLDRTNGKAIDRIAVTKVEESMVNQDVTRLSDARLEQIILEVESRQAIEGEVVDIDE